MRTLIKKIPDVSCLVTTIVFSIKIVEAKNRIPDTSRLMKTTVFFTKIGEVKNKIPDVAF